MAEKKVLLILIFFLLVSLVSSQEISLNPCHGDTIITEDTSNIYMDSKCFNVIFPKQYHQSISFYDSYNDDSFNLKLFSLIDVNDDNENQKKITSFESLNFIASIDQNSVIYTSEDNKIKLVYTIIDDKVKAGLEIDDWTSDYPVGRLILRTKVHKEQESLSHFINQPAVVDDIEQPLVVEEEIVGVNKFYRQTLFVGNSFTKLIQDPIYQVNFFPEPSIHLINGNLSTSSDLDFETTLNITSGLSDNLSSTNYKINFESPTLLDMFAESLDESNTTSLTYVNKLDWNLTIDTEGTYLLFYTAELHYGKDDRLIYTRGTFESETIAEQQWIPKDILATNDYQPFVTHTVKNLTSGTYNLKIDYKVEDAGAIGYIRNARISAVKIDDYFTAYDNTSYDVGTSWQDLVTLLFTPSETKDYFVLATGEYQSQDKDITVYTLLWIDDVAIDDVNFEPIRDDRLDLRPTYYFLRDTFDTTQHNITIAGQEESSIVSLFKNNRITVFSIDNSTFVDDDNEHFLTSSTYINISNMTTEVTSYSDYFFNVYAQFSSESASEQIAVAYFIDDVKYCEVIFENKEPTTPNDDMPFACQVHLNLTVGNYTSNIRVKSVSGGSVAITNLRQLSVPTNVIGFEESAKAISVNWNQTYNSTFDWYLILKRNQGDTSPLYIHAYEDEHNVSSMNITTTITGSVGTYVYNVSSLMDYMTNNLSLGYTKFRIYTENDVNISETSLLKLTEDNQTPSVTNCNLNETNSGCNHTVQLSCLITDNIGVGNVYYMVNETNYTATNIGSNYSYTLYLSDIGNFTYDWQYVFAYDLVSNLNTTDPNLQIQYSCCVENWVQQLGSCLVNDSQLITYTDSNNCFNEDMENPVPIDNGTYQSCNYCSEDLIPINYGECFFNGTSFIRNFSYTDLNFFICCGVTGLVTDCSILYSPYNETNYEACHIFERDFEIDMDTEVYFDFGIGGLSSDKVHGKIYINNTNYTNMTFYCLSYVETLENLVVQTNPTYTKRTTNTISLVPKEIEDREFFITQNGLANVYWTADKLIIDGREYIFGVDCASETGVRLKSEVGANVFYEGVNSPITRLFWFRENTTGIILGLLVFIILIFLSAWAITTLRGRT